MHGACSVAYVHVWCYLGDWTRRSFIGEHTVQLRPTSTRECVQKFPFPCSIHINTLGKRKLLITFSRVPGNVWKRIRVDWRDDATFAWIFSTLTFQLKEIFQCPQTETGHSHDLHFSRHLLSIACWIDGSPPWSFEMSADWTGTDPGAWWRACAVNYKGSRLHQACKGAWGSAGERGAGRGEVRAGNKEGTTTTGAQTGYPGTWGEWVPPDLDPFVPGKVCCMLEWFSFEWPKPK